MKKLCCRCLYCALPKDIRKNVLKLTRCSQHMLMRAHFHGVCTSANDYNLAFQDGDEELVLKALDDKRFDNLEQWFKHCCIGRQGKIVWLMERKLKQAYNASFERHVARYGNTEYIVMLSHVITTNIKEEAVIAANNVEFVLEIVCNTHAARMPYLMGWMISHNRINMLQLIDNNIGLRIGLFEHTLKKNEQTFSMEMLHYLQRRIYGMFGVEQELWEIYAASYCELDVMRYIFCQTGGHVLYRHVNRAYHHNKDLRVLQSLCDTSSTYPEFHRPSRIEDGRDEWLAMRRMNNQFI